MSSKGYRGGKAGGKGGGRLKGAVRKGPAQSNPYRKKASLPTTSSSSSSSSLRDTSTLRSTKKKSKVLKKKAMISKGRDRHSDPPSPTEPQPNKRKRQEEQMEKKRSFTPKQLQFPSNQNGAIIPWMHRRYRVQLLSDGDHHDVNHHDNGLDHGDDDDIIAAVATDNTRPKNHNVIDQPLSSPRHGHHPPKRDQAKKPSDHASNNIPDRKQQTPPASTSESNTPQRYRLPCDDISPSVLRQLDQEVQAFAAYVKLADKECQARRYMVEHLQQTAQMTFRDYPEVNLQVFGSFATLPVCVYSSDVDLALWNIVEPEPIVRSRSKLVDVGAKGGVTASTSTASTIGTHPPVGEELCMRARIERWKTAMAAADALNTAVPDATPVLNERGGSQTDQHFDEDSARNCRDEHNDSEDDSDHGTHPRKRARTESSVSSFSSLLASFNASDALNDYDESHEKEEEKKEEEEDNMALFVLDYQGTKHPDGSRDERNEDDWNDDTKQDEKELKDRHTLSNVSIGNDAEHPIKLASCRSSSSDDDSADKMESYQSARGNNCKPKSINTVSLTSDSDGEVIDVTDDTIDERFLAKDDDHDMQLSIIATPTAPAGPTGRIRTKVVDTLTALHRKLRRCPMTTSVTLIKKARVPIVKLVTKFGVEMDVAVGGQNGTDTSQFCAVEMEKYQSFSAVVLFLKILLNQHGLDVPYTGGLGSYKLYVLVAYHIQQHLQLGGVDKPGDVLLSFLFRYGRVKGHNVTPRARTELDEARPLQYTSDSVADLSNVFLLDTCVQLFRRSWERLWNCVRGGGQRRYQSLLAHVVDAQRLHNERQECLRNSITAVSEWETAKRVEAIKAKHRRFA